MPIQKITPGLVNKALSQECRSGPNAGLLKTDTNALKQRFVSVARRVCPGFEILPEHRQLIGDIFDWCIMNPCGKYDLEKGLWLWGDIGVGKTTLLEIVKAFCGQVRPWRQLSARSSPTPYSFRTSNAIEVYGEFLAKGYPGIESYITSRRQAFDELGSESPQAVRFGAVENVFQYILQRRYERRAFSFTHVTTNISLQQVRTVYGDRIYDRCREMFNFVEIRGKSWRAKK